MLDTMLEANLATGTQPDPTVSRPSEKAREASDSAAIPNPETIRNGVLWDQDRARHRAIEQAELERYMSWAER